ncbi:MAG TPA: protein kinase, partial [Vicinamibacterales bacterium]|nr:protein kinase [Vicinamibacterales bacterium]
MSLSPGTRLGAYEIAGSVGAGGMGEVYRAHDARLERDVAIKILPIGVAADPDRLARFEREARVLASLNHPNIAAIYGVEQSGDTRAIVLELVEGEDLSTHVQARPLSAEETIAIAKQITGALDAAHERGIVHRDLKPANIRLTADGTVKVLDFGLAKAGAEGSSANLTHSPTTIGPTSDGTLLGTAPYMSPEQARGKPVDKRTDIWAFGCVLFEMITGRRAFAGETTSDVIAAILQREPDWSAIPAGTPDGLRALVERCLDKDPKRRLRDIADAGWYFDRPAARVDSGGRRAAWAPLFGVGVACALLGAGAAYVLRGRAPASSGSGVVQGSMRFTLPPIAAPVISADGSTLAWTAAAKDGVIRVFTRRIDQPDAVELRGTDGAALPFLAPDGHAIGFFAGGMLKRVEVATASVQTISRSAAVSLGGTWSANDVIVYSDRFGLHQIPAAGGESRLVAPLNKQFHENSLRSPQFLPDGRHFVYVARSGRPEESGAYLGSLDAAPRRLFSTLAKIMFASPGYLLFVREGTLVAQPFDAATARLSGEAVTLAGDVNTQTVGLAASYSVSDNGILVYAVARPAATSTLHWFDRAGRDLSVFDQPREFDQFRLAPDGRRVAAAVTDPTHGNRSIWILENGASAVRFTFVGTHDWEPAWSPDGKRIAFTSYRNGPLDLYVKDADGSSADRPLLLNDEQKDTLDWAPDGRSFVYRELRDQAMGDILVGDASDPARTIEVTKTPESDEYAPRFSGDGRWIAYVSTESGRPEVIVQPFPPTGAKWQVSTDGGEQPTWRGDGKELYFMDAKGMLQAVQLAAGAGSFASARGTALFHTGPANGPGAPTRYEPARDGQRFLVAVPDPQPPVKPTAVWINWQDALK